MMPQSVTESRYAPTSWGKSADQEYDLEVPSGQVCRVRKASIQGLISAGVLSDIDTLSSLVDEKFLKDGGLAPAMQLMSNPAKLRSVFETIDIVVCHVVVQPHVVAVVEEGSEDPETVAVGDIDVDDKMFIFQRVFGGNAELEQFRGGSDEPVASVETVEDLQRHSSKHSVRDL